MNRTTGIALVLVAAAGLAGVAMAQGYGWGPGMMGPGYGPGYGYGPGMMRGYGPGYGRGMMGGYGYGLAALNLTDEQQQKISKILEDSRSKNWNTMGQLRSEQYKLGQMYYADKVDPNAVADQQKKVDDLRRQMVKSHAETRNQIGALLTPEQRQRFRSLGPWWVDETDEE